MHPDIKRYENKKKLLSAAITVLNLPAWPSMLYDKTLGEGRIYLSKLQQKLDNQGNSGFLGKILSSLSPGRATEKPPHQSPLPFDHPLVNIANALAEKDNIFPLLYMSDDPEFHNASVFEFRASNGQRAASITLNGNPLLLENGEAIARGIIAHELGHLSTSMGPSSRHLMNTTSKYGVMAAACGALGLANDHIKAIDLDSVLEAAQLPPHFFDQAESLIRLASNQPLMLGAAAGFMALAAALPRLGRSHSHATEHIADLHGAELTSPEDSIATMEYLKTLRDKQSGLKQIWNKAIRTAIPFLDTHPSNEKRIKVLKNAFNLKDKGNDVQPPPSSDPAHHAVKKSGPAF